MRGGVAGAATQLAQFLEDHAPVLVLTGAGCSTASGIPDYRDADGAWKHRPPIQYAEFMRGEDRRARYWSRAMIGRRRMSRSQPNAAHTALAQLERLGRVHHLVTQNVDGLHQAAGSTSVIDLHGRIDTVVCLTCSIRIPRAQFQAELEALNPQFVHLDAAAAPDGDAQLEDVDLREFEIPACTCGGILKPDVVFFGENIPPARVALALTRLAGAGALLVVGSSLMVYSGFRFCRAAQKAGQPIAALNLGKTRADDLLSLKVNADCGPVLTQTLPLIQGKN